MKSGHLPGLRCVYNEEQHKVQNVSIWALSDALGPDVLFQYELGKKNNEIARSLLKSYNGTVQTDASALYEQFEKDPSKVMLGCWIHCRRYFIAGLVEDEATAKTAIAAIDRLYTTEHDADIAGLSIEERKEKRLLPQSRCCVSRCHDILLHSHLQQG